MFIDECLATEHNLDDIMAIVHLHRDVFPHVREDALLRQIQKGRALYHNGAFVTFDIYKVHVRLGKTVIAKPGDVITHQVGSARPGDGSALALMNEYHDAFKHKNLFATIRTSNIRSQSFFEKQGYSLAGLIDWSAGRIPGVIVRRECLSH